MWLGERGSVHAIPTNSVSKFKRAARPTVRHLASDTDLTNTIPLFNKHSQRLRRLAATPRKEMVQLHPGSFCILVCRCFRGTQASTAAGREPSAVR